jgi:ankyrin repeat protein
MVAPTPNRSPPSASFHRGSLRELDRNRLREIAIYHGFRSKERLNQLIPPPRPNFIPDHERDALYGQARDYLAGLFPKSPSRSMSTIFKSSKKKDAEADHKRWDFDMNERSDALDTVIKNILTSSEAIEKQNLLRLAQAIIDNEHADATIRKWTITTSKKFTKKSETVSPGTPSTWLQDATSQHDIHLVNLLASRQTPGEEYIDTIDIFSTYKQSILDESLKTALENQSNGEMIGLLLSYGADPNESIEYFESAVQSANNLFVELFLQASTPLHIHHLSKALMDATRTNNRNLIPLLLAHGADCNEHKAEALSYAVEVGNPGAVAAILSLGFGFVEKFNLDRAVRLLFQDGNQTQTVESILSMLLQAGASRNTDELQVALANAVENNEEALVKLLISYHTSPNRDSGLAIITAVKKISIDLLNVLLEGEVLDTSATAAIENIPNVATEEEVDIILKSLIQKGPSNESLGQILIRAVERNWVQLVKWLVEHGATVQVQEETGVSAGELY